MKIKQFLKKGRDLIQGYKIRRLSRDAQKSALMTDEKYKKYIEEQIKKSYGQIPKATNINQRTIYLVDTLRNSKVLTNGQSILCVGCRNANELNYIENELGLKSTGLDLFSVDERILVGDMHKMPFSDGTFDHLYSCHSLEHAYDINVALNEFIRVVKPEGSITIEVPVNFKPNATDYWDLENDDNLFNLLKNRISRVLFRETASNAGNSEKKVIRFIFTKR